MDFHLDAETEMIRQKIAAFINDEVIPLESDPDSYDAHENISEVKLAELRQKAQSQGLWNFQVAKSRGGHGLSHCSMAACYEEAARSIFGPVIFNCAPPDDGNMIVLNKILNEDLKAQFLRPLLALWDKR